MTIVMGIVSFLAALLATKLIHGLRDGREPQAVKITPRARFLAAGLMGLLLGSLTAIFVLALNQLTPLSDLDLVSTPLAVALATFLGVLLGFVAGRLIMGKRGQ
jgi:hypothetical protein